MNNSESQGLYRKEFEKDACGIGFIANMKGRKSHEVVANAIQMLIRMDYRGACGCDPNSGDGAGILLQIPHEFLVGESLKLVFKLPGTGYYGVGMAFFPKEENLRKECKEILERQIKLQGFELLGYRVVPVKMKNWVLIRQKTSPKWSRFS